MHFWLSFLIGVLYVVVVGILANVIGERIPRSVFHEERFPFAPWKWEREGKIYDFFRIKKWKDTVPDMSKYNHKMVPKRVGKIAKADHVYRLVKETCVAEATHATLCALGIVLWIMRPDWIGFVFFILNLLGNLPFIMIQRYNRPALVKLTQKLRKREERKANACVDIIGEHGGRT